LRSFSLLSIRFRELLNHSFGPRKVAEALFFFLRFLQNGCDLAPVLAVVSLSAILTSPSKERDDLAFPSLPFFHPFFSPPLALLTDEFFVAGVARSFLFFAETPSFFMGLIILFISETTLVRRDAIFCQFFFPITCPIQLYPFLRSLLSHRHCLPVSRGLLSSPSRCLTHNVVFTDFLFSETCFEAAVPLPLLDDVVSEKLSFWRIIPGMGLFPFRNFFRPRPIVLCTMLRLFLEIPFYPLLFFSTPRQFSTSLRALSF